MNIKFRKEKNSILNKLFLKIEYMSGDADAYDYENVEIEGVNYTNYQENLGIIKEVVDKYKLIGNLTDINHKLCVSHPKYNAKPIKNVFDYIVETYSEEVAIMYDNVPGDSTCDGQFKAHLSDIELHAYNDKGELFISYI